MSKPALSLPNPAPMSLQTLPARAGAAWVGQAFVLFKKYPIGFLGLVCATFLIMMMVALVPQWGVFLVAMSMPWQSLGFMQASRHALAGKAPLISVFLEPFQVTPSRVRPLLILGVTYLSVFALIMLLSTRVLDEAALAALVEKAAQDPNEFQQLLLNTEFQTALMVRLGLAGLLSMFFWHAPALVYWGGQPVGRALVFNAIALWRNKLAFGVFSGTWLAVGAGLALAFALVLSVTGLNSLMQMLNLVLITVLVTVFNISTYFSFAACFWQPTDSAPE